jgi:hypothetical protein
MGDSVSIKAISTDILDEWLGRIEWHLNSFCERSGGSLTLERLVKDIRAQEYQCWIVLSCESVAGCALTFLQNDATKTCVISHCAGHNYEQWAGQLLATIRVWSHSLGSTKLEAVTRPGWERVLRPLGMVKTHVILELKENG